jgi:alanine-glyoxylate transaminase/serine-glyoxylate transaminase/serine-pyruvate transaminase
MSRPTIDHRGPEFQELGHELLQGLREVFNTTHPVLIFPASGSGAWEAALVNCLCPGDRVLMSDSGQFATLWKQMAVGLGLEVDFMPGDWRHGVDPEAVAARLADDPGHLIKAVCVVHNETSTGIVSRIPQLREAIDKVGHPALFMVDSISSLGSIDYRHDEWSVDVTIGASQKGLMLPPGLSFNAISDKALAAHQKASIPRSFWDWTAMLAANEQGFFPYTPSTNLLYGLQEALAMLREEGLPNVFARHQRHAEATRKAVQAWGLEMVAASPDDYSASITAVVTPKGHDADGLRRLVLDRFDLSLGVGLGRLAGTVFRVGHLGDLNELSLLGTLAGVEMGMTLAGIPHAGHGVEAAMHALVAPVG